MLELTLLILGQLSGPSAPSRPFHASHIMFATTQGGCLILSQKEKQTHRGKVTYSKIQLVNKRGLIPLFFLNPLLTFIHKKHVLGAYEYYVQHLIYAKTGLQTFVHLPICRTHCSFISHAFPPACLYDRGERATHSISQPLLQPEIYLTIWWGIRG